MRRSTLLAVLLLAAHSVDAQDICSNLGETISSAELSAEQVGRTVDALGALLVHLLDEPAVHADAIASLRASVGDALQARDALRGVAETLREVGETCPAF